MPFAFLAAISGADGGRNSPSGRRLSPSPTSGPSPQLFRTAVFTLGNAVNGGFVGAIGPSMFALEAATGLQPAALGRAVLQNRAAKVLGTLVWTHYARRLENDQARVPPKRLLALLSVVAGACALAIARLPRITRLPRSLVLQLVLAVAGFVYGLTDSGMTLLTLWSTRGGAESRTHVAILNAGFTLGALLTPMVVAVSMKLGFDAWPCFASIAILAALNAAALLLVPPPPTAPRKDDDDDGVELERLLDDAPATPKSPAAAAAVSAPRRRDGVIVGGMSAVLFCVTGCEHAVATWLPSFGRAVGGLDTSTLAYLSSAYWGCIAAGRMLWCVLSPALASGWPVLLADGSLMLVAAGLITAYSVSAAARHPLMLWTGTLALGLGCASSLPVAITLPAEARVRQSPTLLLALNFACSTGEMLAPYILGLALERGWHAALGLWLVSAMLVTLGATGVSHHAAVKQRAAA